MLFLKIGFFSVRFYVGEHKERERVRRGGLSYREARGEREEEIALRRCKVELQDFPKSRRLERQRKERKGPRLGVWLQQQGRVRGRILEESQI